MPDRRIDETTLLTWLAGYVAAAFASGLSGIGLVIALIASAPLALLSGYLLSP